MAPEQVLGRRVDSRADLYATGVLLYQLLSGVLPFPGPTTDEVYEAHIQRDPPELPGVVPGWLRRVLWKALAKAPAERFPSAETFLEALSCDGNDAVLVRLGVTRDPRSTLPPADTRPAGEVEGDAARPLQREERSALSLDVIESSRMKQPGLTLVVHKHFAQFRTFVRELLDEHGASHFVWSGDGILALFPRPSQGCACAAAILDGLQAFNEALNDSPGYTPIRVRIGVHHGPVLMSEDQAVGEVFSRTLDTAGHLQKASSEDSALISEPTYYALPDTRGWKRVALEGGRKFPFSVYRYAPESRGEMEPETTGIKGALELEVGIGRLKRRHRVQNEVFIGRPNPSASWTPQIDLRHDDAVSRRHARIFPTDQGFALEDLKSANGTSHNGKELDPKEPVLLHPGDIIEIGDATVIRVLQPAG
jgi:class 3 adenylate cyclase